MKDCLFTSTVVPKFNHDLNLSDEAIEVKAFDERRCL